MATMAIIVPCRTVEKHATNPVAQSQRFMSFSALPLASYARRHGHEVIIIDEYALAPGEDVAARVRRLHGALGPDVLGLSCPSAYGANRMRELAQNLALRFPQSLLVGGGQHFAGLWGSQFKKHVPQLSALVSDEGEEAIVRILDLATQGIRPEQWNAADMPSNVWWAVDTHTIIRGSNAASLISLDELVVPDFELYPSAKGLFPSIEFSRNCRHACTFCANTAANRRGFRRVTPAGLTAALKAMGRYFPQRPLGFYMGASNFSVSEKEAQALADTLGNVPFEFRWRADIRADEITPQCMPNLRKSGLAYLDFGLESASDTTLHIMRKTANPVDYLNRAAHLLAAARNCGIGVKVNYLIHPGDTPRTVAQSREWLRRHRDRISGISASVAIEYPGTDLSTNFPGYAARFGTRRRSHPLSEWGVYNLDPSTELTYENAEILALGIAQEMQTREAFAASKAFGYLPIEWDLPRVLAELPAANARTPYR